MLVIDASSLDVHDINTKIKNAISKGMKVKVRNADRVYGIAAGLAQGEVEIDGDVGDFVAMLIGTREQKEKGEPGPRITINGNAGNYLADGAWNGEVVVKGNAGFGVGIYAYGGRIIVYGNAGDGVGQVLKGATIIINGDVGDEAGLYMVGGDIVIIGNAGKLLGNWMIRGRIFIGGEYESLGNNTREEIPSSDEREYLRKLLSKYDIAFNVGKFRKIVPLSVRPFYSR